MMIDSTQVLIVKLKSLYTRLFLVTLHNRIHQFQSVLHTDIHLDVSGSLYKLIDEIVNQASKTYSPSDYKHLKFLQDKNYPTPDKIEYQIRTTTTVSMTLNGLSLFLQKQNALENAPRMSQRLMTCFWDHVHAAHRFARAGDAKTAKLHADIACNATRSLSQYMSADEYRHFMAEFSNDLSCDIDASSIISPETIEST